ncbi:MAG: glycosyl hydrolase-related protein, partial [Clostridia bacterium]|nr:glycosyl hydrolase-related protein [Clostridia bacterium]
PMPHEKELPARTFRWLAPDGSDVLAYRVPNTYCTGPNELRQHVDRLLCELREGPASLMQFYGVGNHGGGPTRDNLRSIHAMDADPKLPALRMSRVDRYFADMHEQEFPVVQDDLQHHASGCYSVTSRVKRENMRAEQALLSAERWSVVANVLGKRNYPTDLARGWKNTLFNQFHDILAGTSLPSAYEDASASFGEAIHIGARALNHAVQAISWDIDIPTESEGPVIVRPIVVFNPHMWEAAMPVELEIQGLTGDNFRLEDNEGRAIPAQRVASEATVNSQSRLLFVAKLPSLGYALYRLHINPDAVPAGLPAGPATDTILENARMRIAFNPATGGIASLWDKAADLEILRGEGARLCVLEDKTDTWSHDTFAFNTLLAEMKPVFVCRVEEGPVRSTVRVRSRHGESYVTQDFRLYADLPYIEVHCVIDWREEQTMLKVKFPVNLDNPRSTYEIPYGHIVRNSNGEEEPGQGFIDMQGVRSESGQTHGLALCSDCKYSYSMDGNEMAITLLKNSVYAHHNPARLDTSQSYRYTERGVQETTYTIHPLQGDWKGAGLSKRAMELKRRAMAITETFHRGAQPPRNSFASIDRDEITLTVLKQAEDGKGLILRGYETTGNTVRATLSLSVAGRRVPVVFAPYEIKTLYIPYDTAIAAREVNMLEYDV